MPTHAEYALQTRLHMGRPCNAHADNSETYGNTHLNGMRMCPGLYACIQHEVTGYSEGPIHGDSFVVGYLYFLNYLRGLCIYHVEIMGG